MHVSECDMEAIRDTEGVLREGLVYSRAVSVEGYVRLFVIVI
jgi:hypothetical protein